MGGAKTLLPLYALTAQTGTHLRTCSTILLILVIRYVANYWVGVLKR